MGDHTIRAGAWHIHSLRIFISCIIMLFSCTRAEKLEVICKMKREILLETDRL